MPRYEFFCRNCKKPFSRILSPVDCEEGEVLCPHCYRTGCHISHTTKEISANLRPQTTRNPWRNLPRGHPSGV
jgi:hypothetical protein